MAKGSTDFSKKLGNVSKMLGVITRLMQTDSKIDTADTSPVVRTNGTGKKAMVTNVMLRINPDTKIVWPADSTTTDTTLS